MNFLRKIGLTPTEEYRLRLDKAGPSYKKYDLPKRVIVLIATLITVVGLILMGCSCAYSSIHPMIGCGLLLGSLIAFIVGASLPTPPSDPAPEAVSS